MTNLVTRGAQAICYFLPLKVPIESIVEEVAENFSDKNWPRPCSGKFLENFFEIGDYRDLSCKITRKITRDVMGFLDEPGKIEIEDFVRHVVSLSEITKYYSFLLSKGNSFKDGVYQVLRTIKEEC
jgi:hypothetical protein